MLSLTPQQGQGARGGRSSSGVSTQQGRAQGHPRVLPPPSPHHPAPKGPHLFCFPWMAVSFPCPNPSTQRQIQNEVHVAWCPVTTGTEDRAVRPGPLQGFVPKGTLTIGLQGPPQLVPRGQEQ